MNTNFLSAGSLLARSILDSIQPMDGLVGPAACQGNWPQDAEFAVTFIPRGEKGTSEYFTNKSDCDAAYSRILSKAKRGDQCLLYTWDLGPEQDSWYIAS